MRMRKHRYKWLLCLLAAAALAFSGLPAGAEPEADSIAENGSVPAASAESTDSADSADSGDDAWKTRTPDEVFAKMRRVAQNDRLELWAWDSEKLAEDEKPEDVFALVNRKNGYVWWSSPINAQGDRIASKVLKAELGSAVVVTAAQIEERAVTNVRSGDTNRTLITCTDTAGGVKVTYNFRKAGIKIPVSYTLGEDYLQVSIDTGSITEKYGADSEESKVLTHQISVLNAFGAADSSEEGCFVIPDGSGAQISFNNQKYAARTYAQLIYDTDKTAVPKTKGPVVEGVSLPMYGILKGENGLLAVAAKGDGSCWLCADVSGKGQSNTEYNRCYFRFMIRSADHYYMGGDQLNPLNVYEKNLEKKELQVRYYPLCTADAVNEDGGAVLDYADIAARYRQYLTEEAGVQKKAKPDSSALYLDLYGGCMKRRNVLGFPVSMKTSMTSFDEMREILTGLNKAGADDLVVSLNRWTDAGIRGEVDYKAKPAGTLGGKSDFQKLTDYMAAHDIAWYPTVSNTAYYSGEGYWSLTDTAVRVSGSFARIVDYERAYGVPYGTKETMSLLSPAAFPKLYDRLLENYRAAGFQSVSLGALSSSLYGDYSKQSGTTRDEAMRAVSDSLRKLQSGLGAVLSEDPNAYVLPFTDCITDLPLSSSGFNLFDRDIPLIQTVLHGLIPYSTKAVNGSSDAERLVLLAVASGSNLHFDMIGAETSRLKDTDFDIYFYAHAGYWIENAAQYDRFARDILRAVSDAHIISYSRQDDIITTRYSNGVQTEVSLTDGTVSLNGETRRLRDYTGEGAEVFG